MFHDLAVYRCILQSVFCLKHFATRQNIQHVDAELKILSPGLIRLAAYVKAKGISVLVLLFLRGI